MPSLTDDILTLASYVRTIGTIPLQQQMLYSLSVFELEDSVFPLECWAEIGLMIGGTTYAHKVTILASGYVGRGAPIGWTGSMIVLPETFAYGQLLAPLARTYRLAAILYKLIELPEGGFRVDP